MLNNSLAETLYIEMFTRTSNTVERLFSRTNLTLDDQRKRVLPMCISSNKSSYLQTKVYGTLKMLIKLLLKLDKYIFPMKIPFLRESYS